MHPIREDSERIRDIFKKADPQQNLLQPRLEHEFRERVFKLVTGGQSVGEFSPDEKRALVAFVSFDDDFHEKARLLITSKKSIKEFSPEEKRIMEFYVNFDKEFKECVAKVLWNDLPHDDVDPIRFLFVNFDKDFKTLAGEIFSSKKEYHDFSLKEERIANLYANFDVNFLAQARQLVEQHHKKGGFYDHDCKFRYHDTNPRHITARPKSPIEENFTPEEENTIKLYVNFNLEFRNELNKTLRWDRPWTKEADRIFFLGMWYDKDLRVLINSTIWDKAVSEKISDGSARKEYWLISYKHILDCARRKDPFISKEDELYYYLGSDYYDIPFELS